MGRYLHDHPHSMLQCEDGVANASLQHIYESSYTSTFTHPHDGQRMYVLCTHNGHRILSDEGTLIKHMCTYLRLCTHPLSVKICCTPWQKGPVVVEESAAMANAVHLTCPICGQSVAFKAADSHLEACLQEVGSMCTKNIGLYSVTIETMIHPYKVIVLILIDITRDLWNHVMCIYSESAVAPLSLCEWLICTRII